MDPGGLGKLRMVLSKFTEIPQQICLALARGFLVSAWPWLPEATERRNTGEINVAAGFHVA